jgi:hypothetical protein
VITTLQEEATRPKPLMAQATAFEAWQTGGDTAEVSLVVTLIEQGSASVQMTSYAAEEVIPVEASWRGGSTAPMSGESSWDLTRASDSLEA